MVGFRSRVESLMKNRTKEETLMLAILLTAFGLRVFRLGSQPLWSDEIYSVAVAQHSLPEIAGWVYRDNHPALYTFSLRPVVRLLGDEAALVRFPSVLTGTLTVALAYAAGRQILGQRRTGLFAALWLTVSPIHVVYSQEARMYAPLALFGLLSTLFVYRGTRSGRRLDWLLFGLTAAAAAHTHNYGLLLVAAQGCWALGMLLEEMGFRVPWGLALGVATFVLLYSPMVPPLMAQVQMPVGSTGIPRLNDIMGLLKAYGAGFAGFSTPGLTPGHLIMKSALPSAVVTAGLTLLGFIESCKSAKIGSGFELVVRWWRPLLPVICFFLPVILVYGYSVGAQKAIWQVRGFQMALGCLALLVGAGLGYLRPPLLRWAICLSLILAATVNLYAHYFRRYKSTIPDAVASFEEHLGPADEDVLFVAPYWHWTPFRYYYRGAVDAIGGRKGDDGLRFAGVGTDYADLIDSRSLMIQSEVTEPIIHPAQFDPDNYTRVWTVGHWATPQEVVRLFGNDVIVMHYDVEDRRWRAVIYPVTAPLSSLPTPALASPLAWENGLQLAGYRWKTSPVVGKTARLTLLWLTNCPQTHRSHLRIQLLDSGNEIAFEERTSMLSLVNGLPMTALGIRVGFPTTEWPTGSIVAHDIPVAIPPHLPPLSYRLRLQLVDEASGETVPLADDTGGILCDVAVARPQVPHSPRDVEVQHPQNVSFGGQIKLFGYDLPDASPRPGHYLPVWLHWRAEETPSVDYEVQLQLLNHKGMPVAQTTGLPAGNSFPSSLWRAGDLTLGEFAIPLPPDLDSRQYRLAVRVVDSSTGKPVPGKESWSLHSRDWITIGRAEILPWPIITEEPEMEHEAGAQFGDAILLLGYDLSGDVVPGGELTVTFYWKVQASLDQSYHVFVHLTDANGGVAAQADGIPQGWHRPTTTWREGEIVIDEHILTLPSQLPGDLDHLSVGFYRPGGPRLPVLSAGQLVPDGRLVLHLP